MPQSWHLFNEIPQILLIQMTECLSKLNYWAALTSYVIILQIILPHQNVVKEMANGADQDHTTLKQSDLGLHCSYETLWVHKNSTC